MKPDQITYPPLNVPKTVIDGVWIVDSGPLRAMGLPIPVRMTVIRLSGGALLLHSPTPFDVRLNDDLEQLGRIEHLIAPNSGHWTFVREWQAHHPDVVTWAVPGLRERRQVRRSGIRLNHDLGASAPDEWREEIEQIIVPGLAGFAEVVLYHKASRTMVLTDLVQNFEPEKLPRLVRPLAHLAGVTGGRAPFYLRTIVKLKGLEAKAAAERLIALGPERIIFSHGQWFEEDGTARLRKSLEWLLD
ncbi:DUF4336 domain-containing protein [Microvirga brassicacearum]|nr:DUF4336 domain-containing protein [Microvirga brassicacearum]